MVILSSRLREFISSSPFSYRELSISTFVNWGETEAGLAIPSEIDHVSFRSLSRTEELISFRS